MENTYKTAHSEIIKNRTGKKHSASFDFWNELDPNCDKLHIHTTISADTNDELDRKVATFLSDDKDQLTGTGKTIEI